jgi:hypothetical protein
MRLVLYISPAMAEQIREDAARRSAASGLEVSPPAAARALVGAALAAGSVSDALGEIAEKLRQRGAITAAGAASLANALDELAGRLGGVRCVGAGAGEAVS